MYAVVFHFGSILFCFAFRTWVPKSDFRTQTIAVVALKCRQTLVRRTNPPPEDNSFCVRNGTPMLRSVGAHSRTQGWEAFSNATILPPQISSFSCGLGQLLRNSHVYSVFTVQKASSPSSPHNNDSTFRHHPDRTKRKKNINSGRSLRALTQTLPKPLLL